MLQSPEYQKTEPQNSDQRKEPQNFRTTEPQNLRG